MTDKDIKRVNKEVSWDQILKDSSKNKKFSNKQVLVLGKSHSGKRTIFDSLAELSHTSWAKKSNDNQSGKLRQKGTTSALDYCYLNVKNLDDPDDEIHSKISFWVMDDEQQKDLLKMVMNKQTIQNMIITIMLDFNEPWNFEDELNKWMKIIMDFKEKLDIPLQIIDSMNEKNEKFFRNYKDPTNDENNNQTEDQEQNNLKANMPLPEGVLKTNIGIPIMVVCTKSDLAENYEKENDQQKFEFIQYKLRKFCLNYGASLLYVSFKNSINLDIYYEYMLHTLYGFSFKVKAELNNKESIFIPAGYDNMNLLNETKIQIDKEKGYQDVIQPPQSKKTKKDEFTVQEDQEFFKQLKEKLAMGASGQIQAKIPSGQDIKTGVLESNTGDQSEKLKSFYNGLLAKTNTEPNQNSDSGLRQVVSNSFDNRVNNTSGTKSAMDQLKDKMNIHKDKSSVNNIEHDKIKDFLSKNKSKK